MYIFNIFRYKPSIFQILFFGVIWAILMVLNFKFFLINFPALPFSVSFISFIVLTIVIISFFSKFKFRKYGKI
jgi:hypothetical protein